MNAVTLRGLLSRKLRTALTMIAIVLGVSMIAGTYVLTDQINSAFSSIFHTADQTRDAVLTPQRVVSSDYVLPPPLPARLLRIVQTTPGVATSEGEIASLAQIFDLKGNSLSSTTGAPTLLFSVSKPVFRQTSIVRGHWPTGRELVIDKDTFARHHLRLGQVIRVAAEGHINRFTIVGTTRFGTVGNLGGATTIDMELATAQQITGKVGKFDQISVAAAPGVTPAELVDHIQSRIPASLRSKVKVETGSQAAEASTKDIGNALNFLTIGLLAFGFIAVFVGAFIIFNTFSITVAQRLREFGLLRTLGATRAQVLRSVVLEALVVGLLSSVIGILAGIGIAKALNRLFVAFGADLPTTGLILEARTVIVALLVGTGITLLSSLYPAIRATRIPPIAALREGAELPRGRFAHFVPYIAGVLIAVGAVALAVGVLANIPQAGQRLSLIGAGAVVLFLGVAMLTPKLVPPIAAAVGWPLERFTNITGRLARENAVRQPGRTAITASALMIGLALVGFVTIFAAELRKSADDAVNREIVGNFVIESQTGQLIPAGIAPTLRRLPGVKVVAAFNSESGIISGIGTTRIDGLQPANVPSVFRVQWTHGSDATLAHLAPNGALIADTFATDHKLHVGSVLHVTTASAQHVTFTVAGIYKSSAFLANVAIRYDTFVRDWSQHQIQAAVVGAAPGANPTALGKRIDAMLKAQYPMATSSSNQKIKQQAEQSVNQLLTLLYALLAMSVLVSLFGIINTLVLSVFERTREIGMLRAIGTTRGQIRWMVRWESVITAVIGGVLGLLLGVVLAVLITSGLVSQGIEFALPVGQLLIWLVFAMVFGIVAAAFPARRAARLDVLQAIAYE